MRLLPLPGLPPASLAAAASLGVGTRGIVDAPDTLRLELTASLLAPEDLAAINRLLAAAER